MRPFLRWFLFTLCLLVFTGAMVWISLRMLDLEHQRQRTEEDAQVQEKVRLALWRMDSLASALLIRENSRPAYHYQAFYAPDDLFASKTESIPKGQALMPSPLFGNLPDLVKLHFELPTTQGSLTSPQAPSGAQRELATSWYVLNTQANRDTQQNLTTLDALFKRHPEVKQATALNSTQLIQIKPNAPPAPEMEEAKAVMSKDDKMDVQSVANGIEQTQRSAIVRSNVSAQEKQRYQPPLKKVAPPPSKVAEVATSTLAESSTSEAEARSPLDIITSRYRSQKSDSGTPSADKTQRQALPSLAGDLQAVWLENELLLLRTATLEGQNRLQGVWLDWEQLQTRLLDSVRDLLPEARLQSISPSAARTDALALVTLPVKLFTGRVPVSPADLGSALKPTLAIAWLCLIAASLAIAFVLHRAVRLSERRGAFVSAVTHELRTPLTTFRLYSEMLADDMVPDATQRRSYLQTLCDESTRLMHLVENVLAYSRIERGRTAGRMETIQVESLLDRILPRLRQRADQVDLQINLQAEPSALASDVRVDAMAVEQILFNLTDNASKYAAPHCQSRALDLQVHRLGDRISFTLRDYGPGLPKAQKKRLFQPFSKSATEAAHSAPGVGLGLALSRRLARELGGDLVHQKTDGRGASFQLIVKVA